MRPPRVRRPRVHGRDRHAQTEDVEVTRQPVLRDRRQHPAVEHERAPTDAGQVEHDRALQLESEPRIGIAPGAELAHEQCVGREHQVEGDLHREGPALRHAPVEPVLRVDVGERVQREQLRAGEAPEPTVESGLHRGRVMEQEDPGQRDPIRRRDAQRPAAEEQPRARGRASLERRRAERPVEQESRDHEEDRGTDLEPGDERREPLPSLSEHRPTLEPDVFEDRARHRDRAEAVEARKVERPPRRHRGGRHARALRRALNTRGAWSLNRSTGRSTR